MMRSKSLADAEIKVIEGRNESQESQFILDHYKTLYGIGVTSSSPPRPESISSRQHRKGTENRRGSPSAVFSDPPSRRTSQPVSKSVASNTAPPATCTGNADLIRERQSSVVALIATDAEGQERNLNLQTTFTCLVPIEHFNAAKFLRSASPTKANSDKIDHQLDIIPAPCALDSTYRPKENVNVPPRQLHTLSRKKSKMDVSQQSLTQANDERDYDNYCDGPSSVPTSPTSENPAIDTPSIHDDDSGTVHFGNLNHLMQDDTQVDEEPSSIPDDAGLATARGAWRRSSSQQNSSVQPTDVESPLPLTAPPPHTPANPQNPFAGMKKLGDAALVGSQLFGQTQFSSAIKQFSPTSSRPSPHGYKHNSISPNVAETSPLKHRNTVTSPSNVLSSSPQAIRIELPRADDREHSLSHSGPPEDGTVPESPQYAPANTRARPNSMDTYENKVESQRRKRSMEAKGNMSGDDSDDLIDTLRRRRRLAASKQKAASKELMRISVGRRSDGRSVEVPSTTKKPREKRPRRYRTQRADNDSTVSEDDLHEFTVADSQGQARAKQSFSGALSNVDSGVGPRSGLVSSNEAVPDSTGATQKSIPNGVIPGTESSGNSSRPKDLIPETSPNNTQTRADAKIGALLDEPMAAPRTEALRDPAIPLTTEITDPEAEFAEDKAEGSSLDAPEPALRQSSRRSGRKPRPTPKVQDLKKTDGAAKSIAPEKSRAFNAKESTKEPIGAQDNSTQDGTTASKDVPVDVEEEPPMPSSPPVSKTRATTVRELGVSTHNQERGRTTQDVQGSPAAVEPPGSTSTLSVLTTTPLPSDQTSPATQESVELPPLSPTKLTRGRQATKASIKVTPGSRVTKTGNRRQSRRTMRLDSASTDELNRPPSFSGFENSIIQPPKQSVRGSRLSMLSHTSKDCGAKIFAGMAFAISFQSKKEGERPDQYEQRLGQSRDVEKMIVQSGGHLLNNGFDELFDPNAFKCRCTSPASDDTEDSPLTLTPWAQTLGFTALVADGHSRKVKYMQALALGLPCISDRWVTACVTKGMVLDWLPYLLCAGQSAFLRDALRSRNLAPYSATEACLTEVIEQRPKMLEGSKVLLVMKKSRAEDKNMPYVFLAHVLGASLKRSYSLEEAREMLKQKEVLNEPFDWVYVDEHTGTEASLFSSSATGVKPSKKRKRAAVPAKDEAGLPPKRIRTLNNELVIQSLILGRMIEEEELET